jgi:hypothetical protein
MRPQLVPFGFALHSILAFLAIGKTIPLRLHFRGRLYARPAFCQLETLCQQGVALKITCCYKCKACQQLVTHTIRTPPTRWALNLIGFNAPDTRFSRDPDGPNVDSTSRLAWPTTTLSRPASRLTCENEPKVSVQLENASNGHAGYLLLSRQDGPTEASRRTAMDFQGASGQQNGD